MYSSTPRTLVLSSSALAMSTAAKTARRPTQCPIPHLIPRFHAVHRSFPLDSMATALR